MKAVENFQRGNETGDNWYPLNMARGTRTVDPGNRNKGLSSTFQPHEEGRSVQRPKRCDKHGDKDENTKHVILSENISRKIIFSCDYIDT